MTYNIEESVQNILNLTLREFKFKEDMDGNIHLGFIAHEIQEVIPLAVEGNKDAVDQQGNPIYQKVKMGVLVPHLVAVVQSLLTKIDKLEERIVDLEKR